jgi:hypothetical protein
MYFYKLGHQGELGVAEFFELTQDSNFKFSKNWILSESEIDVNISGSLVFSGEIIDSFEGDWQDNLINIEKTIKNSEISKTIKKIGFISPKGFSKNFLYKVKQAGFKKINWLNSGDYPTYGNFLSTKNWLIIFTFQERTFVGVVDNHYKQQFWSRFDESLPKQDMKRGMINLKLARTMLNFTNNKDVFDPFCGVGRSLVAGVDLKERFIGSDIDRKAVEDSKINFDFSSNWFSKSPIFQQKINVIESKFFVADASKIKDSASLKQDISSFSIVTEGFLGTNFEKKPNLEEIEQEMQNQEFLWSDAIAGFDSLNISEIIFCLPFYSLNNKQIYPDFISKIAQRHDYQVYNFYPQKPYLSYKRSSSLVGHCIFKIAKKVTI